MSDGLNRDIYPLHHGDEVMSEMTGETGTVDTPGAVVDAVLVRWDWGARWEDPDDLVAPTRENYDRIRELNRRAGIAA